MKIACAALTLQTYWRQTIQKERSVDAQVVEPNADDFMRILTWASGLGFDIVESWVANETHLSALMEDPGKLAVMSTSNGVSIDYLCCDFVASWHLLPPSLVEKYAGMLGSFADIVGAKTIGTVSPPIPCTNSKPSRTYPGAPPASVELLPGFSWEDSWKRYVESLRLIARKLDNWSLRLAIEPRPREMVSSTDAILRLIDDISVDNLGGLLDTSHLQIMREVPSVSVYKLGRKLYEFHASENDGVTSYHWAPGQGEVNWPDTVAALRGSGYEGAICIDVTGVNVEEEAMEGKKYIESLLRRLRTLTHANNS